ncbi:MAG TPA: F0F1 ATP synthase subunit delta [Allosphingosinicella sp.]|uniref:F0F1 ATP synthase subunit delta n=1 Tax=Allosphingosinicella sp. TaxID=2823234 RepID=UPI002F26E00F
MDGSGGIATGLAGRYATALFELARDNKMLEAVGASLASLRRGLAESPELRELTTSPLVTREQAVGAIGATSQAMRLDPLTANFLGVLAQNRRLGQLGPVIRAFNMLAANHRGETTAEVTSAHPLDDGQVQALRQNLRSRLGRDVAVDLTVDPAILGGLVVKIGSQMIDGSIRTKLNNLAIAMKG